MRTAVNRLLLAATGLVLLAVGLAVLAGGLGQWPYHGPKDVLLSAGLWQRHRAESWWWPTLIAVLGVLVAGSLCWLLAQLRKGRVRLVVIDSGDDDDGYGHGALLRGRALEDIIAAESERLPGVAHAHAALLRTRDAPTLRLVLAVAPHAAPGALLTELDTVVLARARATAGLAALPTQARLRAVRHRAARVN